MQYSAVGEASGGGRCIGNRTVNLFQFMSPRNYSNQAERINFSAGKLRYDYDYVSDDYREFFGNLYFRRGITDSTTLGTNLSYSKDVRMLGCYGRNLSANMPC